MVISRDTSLSTGRPLVSWTSGKCPSFILLDWISCRSDVFLAAGWPGDGILGCGFASSGAGRCQHASSYYGQERSGPGDEDGRTKLVPWGRQRYSWSGAIIKKKGWQVPEELPWRSEGTHANVWLQGGWTSMFGAIVFHWSSTSVLTWCWPGWKGCRRPWWCRERTRSRRQWHTELKGNKKNIKWLLQDTHSLGTAWPERQQDLTALYLQSGWWCLRSWRCGTCVFCHLRHRWCTSSPCRLHPDRPGLQ